MMEKTEDGRVRELGFQGMVLGCAICLTIVFIAKFSIDAKTPKTDSLVEARIRALEISVDRLTTDVDQLRDKVFQPTRAPSKPTGTTRESVGAVGATP